MDMYKNTLVKFEVDHGLMIADIVIPLGKKSEFF
jgi:hypothetical protein